MALDINTAGSEFVKSVIRLYKTTKYMREREILAKNLLQASIQAGALITELGVCPESKEDEIAREAMKELSKAMFVLKIMCDEGVYPQRRVTPIINLSGEIKDLVELYYAEPEKQEPLAPEPPPKPVPQLVEENNEISRDTGGFNEIYKGEF